MPTIEPLIQANVLSEFESFVGGMNVDAERLLALVGWTPADIADPKRLISFNTVAELFELAARWTGDPCFGLHYAKDFPVGGTGLLGHLLLASPTVGDVLKMCESYLELHASAMRVGLETNGDIHSLHLSYPASFTAPHLHYTGFLFALLVLRLRRGAGPDWCPYASEFAHRRPVDVAEYQRIFGPRLTFDAPRYRIDVRSEDFAKPMPQLWSRLAETLRAHGELVLEQSRSRQNICDRTATAVMDLLAAGTTLDLYVVAGRLGVEARALQWRLEQAGTSYERVVALARRKLAVYLLRDTDLTITVIAQRLGYSEASAFTRAAQGWFGEPPNAQRRRLREAGPDAESGTDSIDSRRSSSID